MFTCWSPQPHRGVFWPSFYLLVGIAALGESLNTLGRCFAALSKVGSEAGGGCSGRKPASVLGLSEN